MLFGWQLAQDPEVWAKYELPAPKLLVDSSAINIEEISWYAILPIFILVSYKFKYSRGPIFCWKT
jgi:hypothetical protein